jgi:hypothetical protein
MDDPLNEFNGIEWRTSDTFSALSAFEQFWRETERIVADDASITAVRNGPKWKPSSGEDYSEFLDAERAARHLHDEIITPTFRYSSVVTLFAIFERELKRLADNLMNGRRAPISYKDFKGGLMDQVAKYTEAFCGISIAGCRGHNQIHDLQKIRDCIVHCYGEASLSRDLKHLLNLNSPAKGLGIDDGTPMIIGPAFLTSSLAAIRSFFQDLFGKLGWKINNRWLKSSP